WDGRRVRRAAERGAAAEALYITLAAWAAFEVVLRVRERVQGRGGMARDRGTRVVIALTLGLAIAVALTGRGDDVLAGGVVVVWLGLAIRVWAVATLGRAFRTTVEVDADQPVVDSGPYRWVRHPSYTGLLLITAGAGLASGSWLRLAICIVLPAPALLWR